MGSKHSKGAVRADVAPILPRKWPELEQLHLRFQQEAHRRARADPQSQFFLSFPVFQTILAPICAATHVDKSQLLAIFDVLDRRQRRKLAAIDFFSGLALVVEGKKSAKFEFIVALLDNGGAKTLNKCELMMILMAAVRGLAMLKRSPEVHEDAMKPLAKRLLGDSTEVLRQHVVDKAMADAEILFFMNDLGAEAATTADGLLAQQAKLTQTMGYIDYQFARIAVAEDIGKATPASALPTGLVAPARSKQIASVEVLLRKLQNAVCPLPVVASGKSPLTLSDGTGSSDSQVVAAARAVDVKKRVDARCIQRLVKRISDGALQVGAAEANALVARMAKDPFGLVKCGEVLRVMKLWVRDARRDSLAFWESVAHIGIRLLKAAKQSMERALLVLDASARTIQILPDDLKAATQLLERGNQDDPSYARAEHNDRELHYNIKVAIGAELRGSDASDTNVKFRIGVHPATEDASPLLVSEQDPLSDSDEMSLVLDFGLVHDISDEDAMDLASAVEQYLSDDQVWCHFAPIWLSCQATVGTAIRPLGVLPPSIKYLRVCLIFAQDFFIEFQSETGVDVGSLVRSLFVLGELDKSVQEYVDEWLDVARRVRTLAKRESRESLLQQVFTMFDVDRNGDLDLQEFNYLQQALKKSAIDEAGFREVFCGAQTLSFKHFLACYEQCTAADIADVIQRLGLGSLNHAVRGTISMSAVLFEPALRALEHLLSPLRWGDVLGKKLLFVSRATNDFSCDVRLSSILALLQCVGVREALVPFLTDASLPVRALEHVCELLRPPHAEHERDQVCRRLFCSIDEDVSKTPQQLEFDDLSRGVPTGTSASRVRVLRKFLDAAARLQLSVETLELVEVRSPVLRVVCEFENLRVPRDAAGMSASMASSADGDVPAAVEELVDAAVRERQRGNYRAAIAGLERAIELEDSDVLWSELALTQFQHWQRYAIVAHKDSVLALSRDSQTGHLTLLLPSLLQEAYNTFIIAMEYPANKKNPALLLQLAQLYLEFAAYRGALSVCTLLVEAYAHTPQLPDAIFLSAVTAKALGKHRESAQYFQYLVDKSLPHHRLSAYQLHLLAARALERVAGMHDHVRASYTEAYRAVIALAPVTASEKTAHAVYKTSRKSESLRMQLWYSDDALWFDLATKLAGLNAPLLVLDALDVVRQRSGALPVEMLVLEGVAHARTGDPDAAEQSLSRAMALDTHSPLLRFLLTHWSVRWRHHFALEVANATRIQRLRRRYVRMQTWRCASQQLVQAHRNASACVLQCAWRQRCARRELANRKYLRREREARENAAMATHDMFVILRRLNAAARTIQSLHAVFVAKRERRIREALCVRHATLLSSFALHRTVMARTHVLQTWRVFVQLQRAERTHAASAIQRCVRAHQSRGRIARLLARRAQQTMVLEVCVGKKTATVKRLVLAAWIAAVATIKHTKQDAATVIQRRYRVHRTRRQYRVALQRFKVTRELVDSMLTDRRQRALHQSWDALSANAVRHRLQKRASAVQIQRRVRGILGRRAAKAARARRRRVETAVRAMRAKSSKQLLTCAFLALLENVAMNTDERHASALAIQRVYRGARTRTRVHILRECHRLLDAPDVTLKAQPRAVVLRLCFLVLARLPEQHMRARDAATATIQRSWRHRYRRRRLEAALAKRVARKAILLRLDASFKALARMFFVEISKRIHARKWHQHRAARTLQRALRQWLTRRRYARTVEAHARACDRAQAFALRKRSAWLARVLRAWRHALLDDRCATHRAATRIQRKYRARIAQRRARLVVAKRAAQARLLASVSSKPLERCFRKWEALVIERSTLSVRSSDAKRRLATKAESNRVGALAKDSRTLEQRAEVPSLLFYTLLNRVRSTGICQLSFSIGASFSALQLRQLLELSSSVLCDGGGSPCSLVEQVVASLHDSSSCPTQKLILYNAALDVAHAVKLSHVLSAPSSRLVSLVLGNIPLRTGALVALAGALAHGHSRLEQLVLEGCSIGSAGASALFEALSRNQRLWKLDLSRNHIADSACSALAQVLLLCDRPLAVLCLNENDVSDRGVLAHLAPALEAGDTSAPRRTLRQLALRQNARITTLGRTALLRAAEHFNAGATTSFLTLTPTTAVPLSITF